MPSRRTCNDKTGDDGLESDLHKLEQSKSKINRLKRSPKPPSQPQRPPRTVDTSDITQPDFKTPTRPVRTKFGRLISKESPCNDSEHQHDIIWDQSSPSPVRKDGAVTRGRGRRKEAYTGKTDVNDLVSRIAPKNFRPVDSSDSMLQWIEVSGIPCTPEPSQPTIKTRVTKKDTHDHLKELARQFDFQLTRHEGSLQNRCPVQPADQDAEDLDFFGDENQAPSPAMDPSPANVVGVLSLDQDMDDDDDKLLNELFDGPTVSLENGLSQPLSGISQNIKATVSTSHCPGNALKTSRDSDVRMCSHVPVVSTSALHTAGRVDGGGGAGGGFDDDGLLDDSMVMEMTQHPDLFAPPKHCSTQKSVVGQQRVLSGTSGPTNTSNQHHHYGGNSRNRGLGLSQIQTEVKSGQEQRTGITTSQVRTLFVGGKLPSSNNRNTLPCSSSDLSSSKTVVALTATQPLTRSKITTSVAQPCIAPQRRLPATVAQPKTSQATTWTKPEVKAAGTAQEKPTSNVPVPDGEAGIPDDDLDILFALDSDWGDDVDDDDLLCEAFNDMDEGTQGPPVCAFSTSKQQQVSSSNQTSSWTQSKTITSSVTTAGNVAPKAPSHRPATTFAKPIPSASRTGYSASGNGSLVNSVPPATQRTAAVVTGGSSAQNQRNALKQPSASAGAGATSFGSSSHHTTTANHTRGTSSDTQTGQSSFGSVGQRNSVRPPSTATTANQLGGMGRDTSGYNQSSMRMGSTSSSSQYSFKKPTNSSAKCFTVTTQAPVPYPTHPRCSEAEIERKKQEALERRRLRMRATQNQNQNLRAPC